MPAIQLECEVDAASRDKFIAALARYQRDTQADMGTAIRVATIDLVKSLRARTRQSKKLMPKSAFRFGVTDPQWITRPDGTKWRRMKRKEFPDGKPAFIFWQQARTVYKSRRLKKGGVSESWTLQNEAQLMRDARLDWGKIWNWGFAKMTWGWYMWRIFNLHNGTTFLNPRCNVTHRHVGGTYEMKRVPMVDGSIDMNAPIRVDIEIINRLRYIRKALQPGALSESLMRAANSINKKIDRGLKSRRLE